MMSTTKKRKSDIHIDSCSSENREHPQSKKEKHWFEEASVSVQNQANAEPTTRRKSFFGGMLPKFKKLRSSSALKDINKQASSSKLDVIFNHHKNNETQISVNSESSVTSAESTTTKLPNVEKNAGLRTFVNRDSFTPVPPDENQQAENPISLPVIEPSKLDISMKTADDSLSISSHMSVETIGSNSGIEEDSLSLTSASAFCTPLRSNLNRNSMNRMSTRSVPDPHLMRDEEDMEPALFRSLCNSAVRRVPSTKSDSGFGSGSFIRRSIRMTMQRKHLNTTNMEDVPEEEALAPTSSIFPSRSESTEEKFVNGREFFTDNVTEPEEAAIEELNPGRESIESCNPRLSVSSETNKTPGTNSITRRPSLFRKILPSKLSKERRMSETNLEPEKAFVPCRRASMASFGGDASFAPLAAAESTASVQSNGSASAAAKPKMRAKNTSTSNLTQRFSSVFRRSSSTATKDSDECHRRNTLTGYSSTSSGIGSIVSGMSESGIYRGPGGASVSRNGSKREDERKRERTKQFLEKIVISEIPAGDLLRMKVEKKKRKEQKEAEEKYETQLNESGSSTSSSNPDILNFDVIAVDVKNDGTPFSSVAKMLIDDVMSKKIRDEMKNCYRLDRCGTIIDSDHDIVFVCPQNQCGYQLNPNDSVSTAVDLNPELLPNLRNGLAKTVELWKSFAAHKDSTTILIYPMFCTCDTEWDAKETIDAVFCMLDALMSSSRWMKNGRCILAGVTPKNVSLLREKYEELKLFVAEPKDVKSTVEIENVQTDGTSSVNSSATVFCTEV